MTRSIVNASDGTSVVIVNGEKVDRTKLICSPAQMRLALYRMGELANVQAIANGNPEASIVWEYATSITRDSPLISALSSDHYEDWQIDEMFKTAMAIRL